jgi:uncharacterized membrane protein
MAFVSSQKTHRPKMPFWVIPMIYSGATIVLGLVFPHLEYRYLQDFAHGMTVPIATALFAAIASGMLALTGIVFSLAFVMVQFSSTAYSPRLVFWLSRDPVIWHGMGIFTATFLYSIVALAWVDHGGSGRVPFLSAWLVILLLIASVMVLGLLVQRLALIQVQGVLRFVGNKGRQVIAEIHPSMTQAEVEQEKDQDISTMVASDLPVTQAVVYRGEPMAIAAYDVHKLVDLARKADGLIVMPFAVGDTVIDGECLLTLRGGRVTLSETELLSAVRLELERTFEQDPKYALRLLVDIAIRALSPAVNDPTTAVQALDQITDLLRRLGSCHLQIGRIKDEHDILRLTFPTPTWEDYLSLAFDEIRIYGATSLQVMRRLRTALYDLASEIPLERQAAVRHYIAHLEAMVKASIPDAEDQELALRQDRQGLGLSRR